MVNSLHLLDITEFISVLVHIVNFLILMVNFKQIAYCVVK